MNPELLYQWADVIGDCSGVGKRQAKRLAVFSCGVVWSERCTLSKVGGRLGEAPGIRMDSVERRLQRTREDPKLSSKRLQQAWMRRVLRSLMGQELAVLVDVTALGPHLKVMRVGLAYQRRCILLGWACYGVKTLGQVKAALPAGCRVVVQVVRNGDIRVLARFW
jgi:hypothetical protein